MADHGTVEYATATGNDYEAHESSYERFVHFTLVGILYVVTILFGLATGGVMGHWFTAALIFAIGLLGVIMRRFDFPTAPVVVGMILGPLAEAQMRNALSIGEGRWTVFLQRPGSLALLLVIVAVLVMPHFLRMRRAKA